MPSRSRPPAGSRGPWESPATSSSRSICAASAAVRSRRTADVPKDRTDEAMTQGIPVTYVPARNTVFLSLALAWAETLAAFDIFDRRQLRRLLGLSRLPARVSPVVRGTSPIWRPAPGVEERGRFRIHAPLLTLNKEQIIERGRELGVDYGLTHSCYDPTSEGLSCGRCDACRIRRSAFDRLGLDGPDRLRPARLNAWHPAHQ